MCDSEDKHVILTKAALRAHRNYIQYIAPRKTVFSLFLTTVLELTYISAHMHWHFCDTLK